MEHIGKRTTWQYAALEGFANVNASYHHPISLDTQACFSHTPCLRKRAITSWQKHWKGEYECRQTVENGFGGY
jgi:hypothetical protein